MFGSELKSLKAHPAFENDINRFSISQQMKYSYIPAPFSIYNGIKKLLPGSFVRIAVDSNKNIITEKVTRYWEFQKIILKSISDPFLESDDEAIEKMESLLLSSVKQQMRADVPMGAFLSGGVDSSTIVAMMQKQSNNRVKTFSVGFENSIYNEAHYAKKVASYLDTDHTELYVTPNNAFDMISKMPTIYDEPFSDPSQIPTYLISDMTSKHVKVSLSGDAGDEIFGGYNRYVFVNRLWGAFSKIPRPIRNLVSKAITNISPKTWNKLLIYNQFILPKKWHASNYGEKLHKGSRVLAAKDIEALYKGLIMNWDDSSDIVLGIEKSDIISDYFASFAHELNDIERMMAVDSVTYLPDDILVKIDRAAMAVSLETRVPFLNTKVIEYAWQLPLSLKLRGPKGKWILRRILEKYIPVELIDRPKMGFAMPIDAWLRGPLRDWAESLLDTKKLKDEGYLMPDRIRTKWKEHLTGSHNWQDHLWDVLMFQLWVSNQKN